MKLVSEQIATKASLIKVLVLDVDGVLTNGQIVYDNNGNQLHFFHVRDGLGLKLIQNTGIEVAIITARSSLALEKRCQELGIDRLFQRTRDKLQVLKGLLTELRLEPEAVGAMGDDLIDLPVLKFCGFSATVSDAPEVVKKNVDYVTEAKGGYGAVREVCELILQAKGLWDRILEGYL